MPVNFKCTANEASMLIASAIMTAAQLRKERPKESQRLMTVVARFATAMQEQTTGDELREALAEQKREGICVGPAPRGWLDDDEEDADDAAFDKPAPTLDL